MTVQGTIQTDFSIAVLDVILTGANIILLTWC